MKNKKKIEHIDIKKIVNPNFLKKLNYKELDVLSDDIRNYIIETVSKNGGHLSSNLGVVESTISLCRTFDFNHDKIVFDVGHQCYTYKILTGRNLDSLRKKDGVSGFQRMSESSYDHFEAGHSSTSISVAAGLAKARDLSNKKYDVIAFIGDASFANGLAIEGLNNCSNEKNKIIIVLNVNDMSISTSQGTLAKHFRKISTSSIYIKSKRFTKRLISFRNDNNILIRLLSSFKNWIKRHLLITNIFDSLGYAFIGPIDGHDLKQLDVAFKKAKNMNRSTVVMIKTVKGKGYKYSESDSEGFWHGVNAFDIKTGKIIQKCNYTWGNEIANVLEDKMKKNKKIVLISPATEIGSGLNQLFKKIPDRCLDVGISEEHAITMCGGLSVSGYHPFVSIYSTFLQRSYDQLLHDISRTNQNITLLVDRSGLPGNDGSSHQGIFDESFLYSIPNTVITMPSNSSQVDSLITESVKNHGIFSIRYPKGECLKIDKKVKIPFGAWTKEITEQSNNTVIVSTGPIIEELKTHILINKCNVNLYNAIYLKPFNTKYIQELSRYKKIIIYNPYAIRDGFANALYIQLMESKFKGQVIIKTLPNSYIKHASVKEQLEELKLTPKDILKLI